MIQSDGTHMYLFTAAMKKLERKGKRLEAHIQYVWFILKKDMNRENYSLFLIQTVFTKVLDHADENTVENTP